MIATTVAAALASIAVGSRSIGLGEVWRALVDGGLHTDEAVIVRRLRVRRLGKQGLPYLPCRRCSRASHGGTGWKKPSR